MIKIRMAVALGCATLLPALAGGCAPTDPEADRADLLRLQDAQRRAHLEGDADLLVSMFAEDFTEIARGEVTRPTREESRARFQAYFDRANLLAWDDVSPPVISISDDGSMAHVIVRKRVRWTTEDAAEEAEAEFAWLETYGKRNGRWRLTSIASTQRPASQVR